MRPQLNAPCEIVSHKAQAGMGALAPRKRVRIGRSALTEAERTLYTDTADASDGDGEGDSDFWGDGDGEDSGRRNNLRRKPGGDAKAAHEVTKMLLEWFTKTDESVREAR